MRGRAFLIVALLAIAFPARVSRKGANRGREYALETRALKSVQTLNTAQVQYWSQFGRFAGSLAELGPSGAGLIAADLASGNSWRYRFTLESSAAGYRVAAVPVPSGLRRFDSDQSLAISMARAAAR